jgi:hypothetical protein
MLTALVRPASAETMILENHGADGIVWATTSAFGTNGLVVG